MHSLISRAAVEAFLRRPLDNFAWMKSLKREELEDAVRALPVRPVFKTMPWLHQLVCFYLGCCYPDFSYLLDMGAGKTWVVLNVFNQRRRQREASRMLAFVPRPINLESWENAILDHTFFEPHCVSVKNIEAKFDMLMNPSGPVTVIDYQGFTLAMCKKAKDGKANKLVPDPKKIAQVKRLYDAACFDEMHKLGNADSLWYRLLDQVTRDFRMRSGMTGTLFNRDVAAMHPPLKLVDRGESLGTTLGLFRAAMFTQDSNGFGTKWVFNRSMISHVNAMVGHRSLRYSERELIDLPPCFIKPAIRFHMTDATRQHYLRAVEGVINAGSLEAKKSAYITMRRVTAGYLYWNDNTGEHRIELEDQPKLDYMEGLLDRLGSEKLLVSHEYTQSGVSITDRLTKLGIKHVWIYSGCKDPIKAKQQFCNDPSTRVLVMNSESGGTGTDGLQAVCNQLLFYETPTGPTPRMQVIKRLKRPGQKRRVYVTDMVMLRSVDVRILETVNEGKDFYDQVMSGNAPRGSFFG